MVQDARRFQYTSDYPQPLVTYRSQFTLAPTQDVQLFKFEHGLPYMPLILVKASLTSDFAASGDPWTGANLGINDAMEIMADNKYIYVVLFANENRRTNYIRVIGFAPPDYDGAIATIPNDSNFRFNSDYNYAGCIAGVLNTGDSYEIEHNLGYIPQCRCWQYDEITLSDFGIDISGYRVKQASGIGIPINTGVETQNNISTASKYIIYKRGNEDIRVGAYKTYYHIYTLEG